MTIIELIALIVPFIAMVAIVWIAHRVTSSNRESSRYEDYERFMKSDSHTWNYEVTEKKERK